MERILLLWILMPCLYAVSYASSPQDTSYHYLYQNLPFDMPLVDRPKFSETTVNLQDFGGRADGVYLNTKVFEKAIQYLSEKGGGTLFVPSGIWYTGPIVLQSNINLHLQKGALILFSSDFDLYPLVKTVYEGLDTYRCQSPISGRDLTNVAITGEGSINGSGDAWRPVKKPKVTEQYWNDLIQSGGVLKDDRYWFPSEKALLGEKRNANMPRAEWTLADWEAMKDYLRPVMISLINCKNVLLEGVLFENSPAWNIHPLLCENIIIDGVMVRNPSYAQNGDGLDLESCTNAIVVNSHFDVGDDAICIKSGKDEDGRKRGVPTSNVIVDNCKVFQGHGGFVVGSEMSGGVRNISVSNCQFLGTDVGLRFKSTRGRGGIVENIYIRDINMFNIATESFLFDLYYGGETVASTPVPVDETTPCFRNIYVKDLTSRNARRAMFFNGLPEMKISNINLERVTITSTYGAELSECEDVRFTDVEIRPKKGEAIIQRNVENLTIIKSNQE